MKRIFIFILCFCTLYIHAQDVFNRGQAPTAFTEDIRAIDFIQRNVLSEIRTTDNNVADNEDVVGSAYLEERFKDGHVFYNKTHIGEYMLRYNVYGEEFEVQNVDGTKSAVNKTSEVNVTMDNKRYIFKYYTDNDGRSKFGYFEVLSDPDKACILLKKNKKLFSQPRKAITSFDTSKPGRFVDSEDHYLLFSDKEIAKIRLQKAYIVRFFKRKGADVKSFIKENDLNVKNIEDLTKLIGHYNDTL